MTKKDEEAIRRATADDTFHDAMLAACAVASKCADEDLLAGRGGRTAIGAVRVIRALAEMRGLKCPSCGKPPIPEDRGGGLTSFECECGLTESPSGPRTEDRKRGESC